MTRLDYFSTISTVNCSTVFQFPSVIIYSEGIVKTKTDQTFAGALPSVEELLSHCDSQRGAREVLSLTFIKKQAMLSPRGIFGKMSGRDP